MLSRRNFLGSALMGVSYFAIPQNLFIPGKKNSPFKIAFLTDLHANDGAIVESAYAKIIKALKSETFDLILGGGDWITDGNSISIERATSRFERFKEFWESLPGQKILIPGNHDFTRLTPEEKPSLSLFESLFLSPKQYLDIGGAKIISLQSVHFYTNEHDPYIGQVDEAQLVSLRTELGKTNTTQPIILLLHMPLLSLYYQLTEGATVSAPTNRLVTNNIAVLECFKKHNLQLVLQGHLHVNEFMKWRDTVFITGGALCGKWWKGDNFGTAPGFGIVTLGNAGTDWQYRSY